MSGDRREKEDIGGKGWLNGGKVGKDGKDGKGGKGERKNRIEKQIANHC